MTVIKRRKTPTVMVGRVALGSRHPVVIQAMTDTPTADQSATLKQTLELAAAGAQLVRWTVNDEPAARAVPQIIARLRDQGCLVPVVGDFHYNGHRLLADYPDLARALAKYRINPGNTGRGRGHDQHFAAFIKIAIAHDKPVRIGVNGGSLDPELFTELMDRNARKKRPASADEVTYTAMVESALKSARYAQRLGLPADKIVLSVKMSGLQDMVTVYSRLAARCDFVLHLGLTEAGSEVEGTVASAAALAILLQQGIGDTIRVSLTPQPGIARAREVEVAQSVLQSLGLRYFAPRVISCPGCGRTNSDQFQVLAREVKAYIRRQMPEWRTRYPGVERLTIAVMGCVVNGPGESRHADIGISLPGAAEQPAAPVFADGKSLAVLKGPDIAAQFINLLDDYLARRFSTA